jgi:hypothetical protein
MELRCYFSVLNFLVVPRLLNYTNVTYIFDLFYYKL